MNAVFDNFNFVIEEFTGSVVCKCENVSQAMFIANLLNERRRFRDALATIADGPTKLDPAVIAKQAIEGGAK